MALKYYFEFTDVKNILHRVEISDATFVGDSTQIYGSCSLEYSETKDTLESVRGSGLQIDLEANSALTFYDLYSEEERTFSVVYTRATEILFNGWLSPEGIYESLVSDKWIISLDCTDGLGFLANLSYVEDATGLNFVGKQSALEIITNCLKRTKTPQNILTSIDIYYDGLSQTLDPFDNVYFNADRFIKDDEETIMDCEEVIKSVLEPFGAVITSYKGEWLIYKPNSLFDSSSQVFFAYDSLGIALGTPSRTIDFSFDLGSQIDNYYPHHVNANQQKTVKSSIGAFRISYKYGLVKSLLSNPYLSHNNYIIYDWSLNSFTNLTLNTSGFGVDIETIADGSDVKNITSSVVNLSAGDFVNYIYKFKTIKFDKTGPFLDPGLTQYKIILTDGTTTYYWNITDWATYDVMLTENISTTVNPVTQIKRSLTALPISGDLTIEIWTSIQDVSATSTSEITLQEVSINTVSQSNESGIKGEFHTFQRTLKPSSKIKDVKKVSNGDNPSDLYYGTIYKADESTPTDSWTRLGASETKAILQIMGEERMKMYSKPLQVYKGDVYGYFNYLSLVTINGLTGKFMPTTYSYNALSNITSLELTEVLNTDILSDVLYELTFDYGNVVEPTIKG